jgi:hypothetical protein
MDMCNGGMIKGDARLRRCNNMQHDNQLMNKRLPEEKWTRGGGTLQGKGGALREQEKVTAQQQGQCNNQLANKRQTVLEASTDGRQRSVERTRDGGGATKGIATTNQQTRDKRGRDTNGQRGGGVFKAGGASGQQEVEVAWHKKKRRSQHVVRTRGKGRGRGGGRGGGGATRCDAATSQGKLEVNRRRMPKGLADKDNNNEALQTGRTLSTNAVKPYLFI